MWALARKSFRLLVLPFCHTGVKFQGCTSHGSQIIELKLLLNQDHLSRKLFFWSNPYKVDVLITSLTEMLEIPNFVQTPTILSESRNKILLVMS